ncbi:MAG: type I-C CRISPR-associated protein Cas8c/Csd1 [Eubacteriales bacterium]|nr:type I-C CRISPR-associated protein Cas8c/Csd1 [Eubacteriales bacterium]
MILQALSQYYERLADKGEVERPGWGKAKVSYGLQLAENGELLRAVPLKQAVQRGKKTVLVPVMMAVPEPVTRSSGISANFLCDSSSYLLGVDKKGKPERARQCFEAAAKLHCQILENCSGKAAVSIRAFFQSWDPEQAGDCPVLSEDWEDILAGGNLIFLCGGVRYAQEDEEIRRAWMAWKEKAAAQELSVCMVTGQMDEIARIHTSIRGIPGAQTSGAALISFNAPSFESYGKEQSFNAPVGRKAMYAYTAALNYLINGKGTEEGGSRYRTILGDTVIVFWSESGEPEYQNVFMEMMDPGDRPDTQELLKGFFQNLKQGKPVDIPGIKEKLSMAERFYVLGIAPNAARLSVRFFYQDSFGGILRHVGEHYERMRIRRPKADTREYPGIWSTLWETVNKKSRDKKPLPHMAAALYRSVLSGERYPESLYSAVLERIRAEQDDSEKKYRKITAGRAAIIKAYLIRNKGREDANVELNEKNTDIGYVLGREFSVLEAIQEAANPGINTTIKDRYFNSACATPGMVFPILFRLKNSHIRKLSAGQAVYYEKMLGNLQEKISVPDGGGRAYPSRLSLEEQGMFILGYYHQTQKRYEGKVKEDKTNG